MDREITKKRITEWRRITVSATGRTELRWEYDVRGRLGKMRIQNLSKMDMDRKAWKRIKQSISVRYSSI
jgi:hypothetical protein